MKRKELFDKLKNYFEGEPLRMPEIPPCQNNELIRMQIIFGGVVQGVGFRFEVGRTAEYLGLTGWVKNLSDGTVEAEVQGDKSKIDYFCSYLISVKHIEITNMKRIEQSLKEQESVFKIIY